MSEAVDALAVVMLAALAGNEFAIAAFVHPILSGLDDSTHRRAVQPLARITGRAMPFWYAACLILLVVCIILRRVGTSGWWLSLSAAVLVGGSILGTLVALLPINNRVARWDPDNPPANWRDDRSRWDRRHRVRVAMLVVAAAFLAAASVSRRG